MEVCVHGSSMASPAFQRLLYTALRALIDELGVATFNACECTKGGWVNGWVGGWVLGVATFMGTR